MQMRWVTTFFKRQRGTTSYHSVVEDGSHLGDMEVLVHLDGVVVEVLLAPRILGVTGSDLVVLVKGLLELRGRDADLLGQLISVLEVLHQATANVVLAVPLDFLGGSSVEDQADGELVLPHHTSDVVTVTELIAEALAIGCQQQTTDTAEGLSGQELDLGIGLTGIDQTGRVNLDLFHVDGLSSDGEGHLDTVSSSVVAVGGGQIPEIRAVLLGAMEVEGLVISYVGQLIVEKRPS